MEIFIFHVLFSTAAAAAVAAQVLAAQSLFCPFVRVRENGKLSYPRAWLGRVEVMKMRIRFACRRLFFARFFIFRSRLLRLLR